MLLEDDLDDAEWGGPCSQMGCGVAAPGASGPCQNDMVQLGLRTNNATEKKSERRETVKLSATSRSGNSTNISLSLSLSLLPDSIPFMRHEERS